jgi:biotin carboxylase
MKKIMILGASTYQLPAIQKSKDIGLFTIVCSNNPDDVGMKVADRSYIVSTIDKYKILKIAQEEEIDGIITIASEIAAPTVAYVAENMDLWGCGYDTASAISNKYSLRYILAKNDIPTPKFWKAYDLKQALEAFDKIHGTAIMKPLTSSGSRGVFKINSIEDIKRNFDNSISYSFIDHGVILEEFMSGREVGGESLINDGEMVFLQITNKYLNKFNVPIGHSIPSNLPMNVQRDIEMLIQLVVDRLNLVSGPLNFDIMITDKGPRIIELGARLGGNCLPNLMLNYTGVDTIDAVIKMSLREKPDIDISYKNECYGVKILGSYKPGILRSMTSVERLKFFMKDVIIDARYDCEIGEDIFIFDQGSHRLGHVFVKGRSIDDVEHTFEAIDKIVSIDVS